MSQSLPAGVRASTLRRIEKLKMLVAALEARDMDYPAAAAALHCSLSAARQYLQQLADAGLIVFRPGSTGGAHGGSYRLRAEPAPAAAYLAALAESRPGGRLAASAAPSQGEAGAHARIIHVLMHDVPPRTIVISSVRRDPLITALFGKQAG